MQFTHSIIQPEGALLKSNLQSLIGNKRSDIILMAGGTFNYTQL